MAETGKFAGHKATVSTNAENKSVVSLNFRKDKVNTFLQADWLYTQTLNRNEFTERYYDNGEVVKQQAKRKP
jgi:hypothetical protein